MATFPFLSAITSCPPLLTFSSHGIAVLFSVSVSTPAAEGATPGGGGATRGRASDSETGRTSTSGEYEKTLTTHVRIPRRASFILNVVLFSNPDPWRLATPRSALPPPTPASASRTYSGRRRGSTGAGWTSRRRRQGTPSST